MALEQSNVREREQEARALLLETLRQADRETDAEALHVLHRELAEHQDLISTLRASLHTLEEDATSKAETVRQLSYEVTAAAAVAEELDDLRVEHQGQSNELAAITAALAEAQQRAESAEGTQQDTQAELEQMAREHQKAAKLQQQHVAELKKTLQRHLKQGVNGIESGTSDLEPPLTIARPPSRDSSQQPSTGSMAGDASLTNMEYLKNIVIKYILGKPSEVFQALKICGFDEKG